MHQEMQLAAMSEFKDDIEELRVALMRLRPTVRPYIVGGLWLFLFLMIAWDIKRYLGNHAQSLSEALPIYAMMIGVLVFDYVVERRLRREKENSD